MNNTSISNETVPRSEIDAIITRSTERHTRILKENVYTWRFPFHYLHPLGVDGARVTPIECQQ